ncbi:MAG: transcription-repair coupling factor [Bacteroidales bacterium]|nr:transcription-repair coupling factor [Bacteroidales bacterium]
MESANFINILSSRRAQKELLSFLNDKRGNKAVIDGLYASSKAYAVGDAIMSYGKGIHIAVLPNREEAQFFTNDMYNIIGEESVFYFPTSSHQVSRISTIKDSSQKVQRSAAISALNSFNEGEFKGNFILFVTYPGAIYEKILNHKSLKENLLKISVNDSLSHEFIKETLYAYNFEKVDFVSEPGQFALRGGIIDLFSFSDEKPYRLDFWGDNVESIKHFDINTQRSIDSLQSVEIFPNIYSDGELSELESVSIFDYVQKETFVWIDKYTDFANEELKEAFVSAAKFKNIYLENPSLGSTVNTFPEDGDGIFKITYNTSLQPSFNKNFDLLLNNIKDKTSVGYKVFISSDNPKQIERLRSIFAHNEGDNPKNIPVFEHIKYSVHSGFIDHDAKVCLYTDHQIFNRYHRVKVKREVPVSERLTLNELSAFQIGDYVVHIDHGIGVFGGLVKTNINGKVQEAIKLVYKDNDVIFVSIHGIHRISRYKSKDGTPPKIYKLGTGAWEKLKNTTKSKVKDIAKDLIKLYAERRQAKGFSYSPDSYLQHELEASFMYEDTPDQLKATKAVKEDMEREYPMDRLVCGDVGFGKTEVAVRAAFKAVADNKQVALLVPTTILALQHYKTFAGRLKDFPCNIEYISRLKSTKEIKDIAQRLKEGKIDIIIGTHRLLNKEIEFKDLGLLIIDEEQKFGVAAKERLKQIKLAVDTLTLTATPIPRTLQFSLLGARDLSIINTPPPNRLPVQTEIMDFNEDYIREIIKYEIERGGQVYFVHNKVEDILAVEDILKRICPGIKTCVGHGQMDPKELEGKILDFMAGDYDVLVATTIVENGIDVPNANTIIINQAQNFGLSDLHQLRGRVGRSNIKAFCYLIVPPMVSISDDARRRLRAIEAFSDLGSGFNIAMQDLDIRGAGNLLGGEQSGFIADMGFETYQRILSEAFVEIKQEEYARTKSAAGINLKEMKRGVENSNIYNETLKEEEIYITDCSIDTDLELLIPDNYIPQISEKIRLYKELDTINEESKLQKFIEELKDRFGELPEQLMQLTYVVRLRKEAIKLGFERIVIKNGIMLAYFVHNQKSPYYQSDLFASILGYLNGRTKEFRVKEQNNKLMLRVVGVDSMEKAYNIVTQMKKAVYICS